MYHHRNFNLHPSDVFNVHLPPSLFQVISWYQAIEGEQLLKRLIHPNSSLKSGHTTSWFGIYVVSAIMSVVTILGALYHTVPWCIKRCRNDDQDDRVSSVSDNPTQISANN